jgi:6-phosphogluconolactonase
LRFSRRVFVEATAGLLLPAAMPARALQSADDSSCYAYVGTYTPNGGGIYLFRMDRATGALAQLHVFDGIRNPSWLALGPSQKFLYAVSEVDNFSDAHDGAVTAFAVDVLTGQLSRLNTVSSGGATPAHLSVHPSGRFLFVANHGGGSVAVLPINPDGTLAGATDVRPSIGALHHLRVLDDPPGQFGVSDHEGPHMHMIGMDPGGQLVIANDAGLDLTLIWRFDEKAGRLLPAQTPVLAAPAGSAPRHFVFHPNGRWFYNLYEHEAKIACYDYDAAQCAFKWRQSVSTLPQHYSGSSLASEITITADGRFIYVANRLHSAIAAFAVAADGALKPVGETWTRADSPRSLLIDPTQAFLYSCNQRGDCITSFRINAASGALTFTGRFEPVGSPAVMVIAERR